MDFNIRKMVEYPSWKEMLLDLVTKQELNPWDIDINALSESFVEEIKKMQRIDFHMPANLILAASILLRFKSYRLEFEPDIIAEDEVYIEDDGPVEVTMLELHKRLPRKRPVTLNELLVAMDQVFKKEEERAVILAERRAREASKKPYKKMVVQVSKYDIEKEQERTLELIKQNVDDKKLITFSHLKELRKDDSAVYTLLPLLYIYQKGMIDIKQKTMFNEIIIQHTGDLNGKISNT
ncbi:segregation/condensation protein A [Candidatus Micrarchaeota archaeon]|nr:segregation/condensation protein A [Candidatus Micrarchaeota archaeon]